MSRFRVAMVSASPFPTLGGSQVFTRQLAEALAARGHTVHLVTYHLAGAAPPVALPVHRIPPVPGYTKLGAGPSWAKPFLDLLLAGRLLQVVRREHVQVIHAHNMEALACGLLVRPWTGVPVVYHGHNILEQELPAYFQHPLLRRLARGLGRMADANLPRRADAVLVLTAHAADVLRDRGVPAARLHLIPPGIDCPPVPVPPGMPGARVVYAGNLDPYQDMELLLHAWPLVQAARPDATLTLISASFPRRWAQLAAASGPVPGLQFVLGRDFDQVWDAIGAADVVVCPRTSQDGFPIKLLNYMAAGRPIVVSAGSAHGLTHGETAYVVPNGDGPAFAAGIVALLNDPALARRLGAAAHQLACARHAWDLIAGQVEIIYRTLA
ncbi:MAG: glycosyltransferase family 4 protein [Chloroflexi bacterium]|nr:glycosyltransferase family 4 protein [Chloroflexota bacterium]